MNNLQKLGSGLNVALVGASGGIGEAILELLVQDESVSQIYAYSRSERRVQHSKVESYSIDYESEESIERAASMIDQELHVIIVTTGFLHGNDYQPEKALRDLSSAGFQKNFLLNCIGPSLIAKYFISKLSRKEKSVFAAISARVGSISDNELGGWYAYRASKAALNMVIKTTAIEVARRYKEAVIIGLHPGTVETQLSEPFRRNVHHDIFSPAQSASYLLEVIAGRTVQDTGKVFAWDGEEILP